MSSPQTNKIHSVSHQIHEARFVPPENIAAQEDLTASPMPDKPNLKPSPNKPKPWRRFINWFKHLNRWQKLLAVVILVIIAAAAYDGYVHFYKKPTHEAKEAKTVYIKPKPTTEPSRLTGVQVSPELNKLPVTAIMIENSPDARPQSGLKDAGIVFEAVAEGGITRFLTLFQAEQPTYVGPVRSARPYYLQWLLPFDAAIAHVGGSPDALQTIKSLHIRDLDEFANAGAYQRISSRYAPHNVYTGLDKLHSLEASKGITGSNFTSFSRKADKALATPTASTIDLNISGAFYNAHFDYDKTTNSYMRSEGGQPHVDEKSGRITPKVVVVLVMAQGLAADGQHTTYNTIGSGQAYYFQDGGIEIGTWQKSGDASQFVLTNSGGKTESLNAGQTWFTIVGDSSRISYKP